MTGALAIGDRVRQSVDAIFFDDPVTNNVHAGATLNYGLSKLPFGVGWKKQRKAQRGHGIILRSAAEERPRPPVLEHPRATVHRDDDLIERTYHRRRRQARRGCLTPIEFETMMNTGVALAA